MHSLFESLLSEQILSRAMSSIQPSLTMVALLKVSHSDTWIGSHSPSNLWSIYEFG